MVLFVLFPVLVSLLYSFLNTRRGTFIGLNNYYEFLFVDPKGIKSFINTFLYVLIRIPATVIPGFFIANALNNVKYGRSFMIVGFFAPYITSMVAYSTLFIYIFNNAGLLNSILRAVGLPSQGFIRDIKQALPSIALMDAFKHIGFDIIIYLSALQGIPETFYEAARIDGASNSQITFRIKLPLLKPTILYLLVVISIWTLRVFEPLYVMTGGGPLDATRSVVLYAYQAAFQDGRLGYASAITILLFIIIFIVTLIELRIGKSDDSY
ncbi:sugar ABC transporter permease [Treponema sp. OttesenSCG-928-L16]|nr:sugar ABC transporter permease [Treponema sp. OttesenSCG-928-L16]